MRKKENVIGNRYSRLVVIEEAGEDRNRNRFVKCKCECGEIKICPLGALKSGKTKSCGCLNKENIRKHGMYYTPEYNIWWDMKDRCYNRNNKQYSDYGGRGITICDRWLISIENFVIDMGRRPSSEYTIDRIDNDGNYTPENCRWATRKEQARNKRSNVLITMNGETKCMRDWAEEYNINPNTVCIRIKNGWSPKDAILTPVRIKRSK